MINSKISIQSTEGSSLLDVINTDKFSEKEVIEEDKKFNSGYDATAFSTNRKSFVNEFVNGLSPYATSTLPYYPIPNNHSFSSKFPLPSFQYVSEDNSINLRTSDLELMEINRLNGVYPAFLHRRPRGEKRPIPEEQKDEKYYERRKRNNEAAKKSRDARKIREDRIAFRAALLEQENTLLRAQILALRDELQTMRRLIDSSVTTPPIT